MQNRIESINNILIKNNKPSDVQATNVRDVFFEKFLLIEEMIEVMIDDKDYKASALQSLMTSFTMINCGVMCDQVQREKKKGVV